MTLPFTAHVALTHLGVRSISVKAADRFSWIVEGDPKWKADLDDWLRAYQAKKPIPLKAPLDLDGYPPFTKKVLYELTKIPFGETCSYADIAKRVDNPLGSRAVGQACGRNPILLIIPCHRVIASNGGLGGFSGGGRIKQELLRFERECKSLKNISNSHK